MLMINESRSLFFEKINKIDKPLTRLIKKKRGPKYIKSEVKEKLPTDTTEIQRIVKKYYEELMPRNLKT